MTSIALDETGEYITSCSDDGVVAVSGLYSDEHNQTFNLDQPVKVSMPMLISIYALLYGMNCLVKV